MEIMWNYQICWKGLFICLYLFENMVYDGGIIDILEILIEIYVSYYCEDCVFVLLDWCSILYFFYIFGFVWLVGGGLLIYDIL